MLVRERDCMGCGYFYVAPVEYSESATGISGELSQQCPRCGSRDVYSKPVAKLYVTDSKREEIEKNGIRYRMEKGGE